MICPQCDYDPCQCHVEIAYKPTGRSLRVNRCDVPGCQRIFSAGDPDKNLTQGLHLATRCRFHRDPTYRDCAGPYSMPVLPDTEAHLSLDQAGREQFHRLWRATREDLEAYWREHAIVVKPPTKGIAGWERAGDTLSKWANKWFPPIP